MKRNWKSMLSLAAAALCLCTCMTGCGDSAGGGKSGTFYDLLDAEWDRTGVTSFSDRTNTYCGGKIFSTKQSDEKITLYAFDMNEMASKELAVIEKSDEAQEIYFCNGYFYYYCEHDRRNFTVTKYDSEGKEVSVSPEFHINDVFIGANTEGYLFVSKDSALTVISPDMTVSAEFETVSAPDSHGNERVITELLLEGSYQNRTYFWATYENGTNGFAVYDTASKTWSNSNCNEKIDALRGRYMKTVGKYLLTSFCALDMETDEHLVTGLGAIYKYEAMKKLNTPSRERYLSNSYYGGTYCIVKTEDMGWGTIVFDTEVQEVPESAVDLFPATTGNMVSSCVDDRYFIYSDASGRYLREYTNPTADVGTICLFD